MLIFLTGSSTVFAEQQMVKLAAKADVSTETFEYQVGNHLAGGLGKVRVSCPLTNCVSGTNSAVESQGRLKTGIGANGNTRSVIIGIKAVIILVFTTTKVQFTIKTKVFSEIITD